jgi:tetratricopeptide (TPR) repeat protein
VAGATLPLLSRLVEKSLIRLEEAGRYSLHELLRFYAANQLEAWGQTEAAHQAHLAYFEAVAEKAATELQGANQLPWLDRLEAEHYNLVEALRWALDQEHVTLAARLAGALGSYWAIRGHLSEGEYWLGKVLVYSQELTDETKARVLYAAGSLAFERGDYSRAKSFFTASLAQWRELGESASIAESLNRLGHVAQHEADFEGAIALYEESRALYRQLGDQPGVALALNRLGHVAQLMGDYSRAAVLLEESLELRRALGDKRGIASSLNGLAEIARVEGEHRRAESFYRECLALCEELGDKACIAGLSHNLAHVMHRQGNSDSAAALFGRALALYQELTHKEGMAISLAGLAGVAATRGQAEYAARLFGAAEVLLEASHAFLSPPDKLAWEDNLARLRRQLAETALQTALIKGRLTPLSDLIRDALEAVGRAP